MARDTSDRLFSAAKIPWLLEQGLDEMDAAERQMLLVMAETKIQDGYSPTQEEQEVVEKLRAMAGNEYDARDIKRKVRTMVKGRSRPNTAPLKLPPMFDRLRKRFRGSEEDKETD